MALSRRRTVQLGIAPFVFGWLPGCLGLSRGSVRIRIDNRDDTSHTLDVVFSRGGETLFSDQYAVSANEEITVSDVVAAGDYLVTVTPESGRRSTLDFSMQGCNINTVFVHISESGELDVTVLDEC